MGHGGKREGAGRPIGNPNLTTTEVREAIAVMAKKNAGLIDKWLMDVKDPAKRVELFLRALEYHIPKVARVEHTGQDGGPVAHTYRWLGDDDT